MPELFLSYAPNAEDVVVWRALGEVTGGRYLDVHLALGEAGQGTRAFYERGWRGVHVVARPEQAEAVRRDRPDDIVATEVEGRSVDELLGEAGVVAGKLHVCRLNAGASIDAVLNGFDLAAWRPWVVVATAVAPVPAPHEEHVVALGYRLCLFDGVSRMYVSDDHAELAPRLSIPVSVLDAYEPAARNARRVELDARARTADERSREFERANAQRRARVEAAIRGIEQDGRRWRGEALHEMVRAATLRHELTTTHAELEATYRTVSWRATRPLRRARVRQLARETRRHEQHGGDGRSRTVILAGQVRRRLWRSGDAPSLESAAPAPNAVAAADLVQPAAGRSTATSPVWSPEEAAFADRLDTAAALLTDELIEPGGPRGDLGAAAARFERALHRTARRPETVAWLAAAAARATAPGEDVLDSLVTLLELKGPGALADLVWTEGAQHARQGAASTRRLRVHEGGCIVDVTHTAGYDFHTGVQRVVRETVSRWWAKEDLTLFGWDLEQRIPSRLDEREIERFHAWQDHVVGGSASFEPRRLRLNDEEMLVPWDCTLVVPEIAAEPPRTDAYRALVRAGLVRRFGVIVYDLIPVTIRETAPVGMAEVFSSYLAMVKLADRVSAISEATAEGCAAFSSMVHAQGLPGPEVAAHPLPSDVPILGEAALDEARERFERDPGPMVLVVGSHEPRKNHAVVLLAAERLWRDGLAFHLLFIGGSGWRGERFDGLVDELVAAGRPIQVVKRASEETLWAAYRLARFSVFPSLAEGFGLPVAESLACATPVITSNFGSMAEIGRQGGALLVDPRSVDDVTAAMRSLLFDDELLDRLRAEARNRPQRSWDDYAEHTWTYLTT